MTHYKVQAEFFATGGEVSDGQLAMLHGLLVIYMGAAQIRPNGWSAQVSVADISPGDAALQGGALIRAAAAKAEMPEAIMTDVHVTRIGGWNSLTLQAARAGAELYNEYGDPNDVLSSNQREALAFFTGERDEKRRQHAGVRDDKRAPGPGLGEAVDLGGQVGEAG